MKNILLVACGLLASSAAYASCDSSKLNAAQLSECITIEGAGENYDHWKAENEKIGTGQSREEDHTANRSGQDVPPKIKTN